MALLAHSPHGVLEAKGSPTPRSVHTPQSAPSPCDAHEPVTVAETHKSDVSPRSPPKTRNGPGEQGLRLLEGDKAVREAAVAAERGDSKEDMDVCDSEAAYELGAVTDQARPPSASRLCLHCAGR
jgi:hypothetical protein